MRMNVLASLFLGNAEYIYLIISRPAHNITVKLIFKVIYKCSVHKMNQCMQALKPLKPQESVDLLWQKIPNLKYTYLYFWTVILEVFHELD